MVEVTQGQLALAFGLVLAAGFSTAIGASLVFCSNIANHRILAGALGISAGVMLYVSFAEIFCVKSVAGFSDAGYSTDEATRYATFCFFGGMVILWGLDKVVHGMLHLGACIRHRRKAQCQQQVGPSQSQPASEVALQKDLEAGSAKPALDSGAGLTRSASNNSTSNPNPTAGVQDVVAGSPDVAVTCAPAPVILGDHSHHHSHEEEQVHIPKGEPESVARMLNADHHNALARMGLLSALAIGIHNFPEGLATFVGTLAEPSAGIAIAVAIALHNIPEGVVVAMPIYYSTGSKLKGFLWAMVSGVSEPIGALLGWAILRGSDLDPLVYALMFGLVAGMMVYISLKELLPTALKFDPEDRYVTRGLLLGMLVMAASLLLFKA